MDRLRPLLAETTIRGSAFWAPDGRVRPCMPGGFAERVGRYRIGQQSFREQLLRKFGAVCAFTGPQHPAALDAAHLYRYSETPEHDTSAGLLLRRDLHSLFDRWLIAVDPGQWCIRVSPALLAFTDVAGLDGLPLQVRADLRPHPNHLTAHFALARTGW
ncbi:HNH endonuclease [Pseudonocardia sulfidoxydans]